MFETFRIYYLKNKMNFIKFLFAHRTLLSEFNHEMSQWTYFWTLKVCIIRGKESKREQEKESFEFDAEWKLSSDVAFDSVS